MIQQNNISPAVASKAQDIQEACHDGYRQKKMQRINDVKEATGLSRSLIYSKLDPKSKAYDSTFPKRVKLGARAVGWDQQEIDAWLQQQLMMRH